MDGTTPHGRTMLQMSAVFAELERGMIREHVMAGLERAGKQASSGPAQGRSSGSIPESPSGSVWRPGKAWSA
jgi:DNA invertase Pin-like site-specific DNA recombinase